MGNHTGPNRSHEGQLCCNTTQCANLLAYKTKALLVGYFYPLHDDRFLSSTAQRYSLHTTAHTLSNTKAPLSLYMVFTHPIVTALHNAVLNFAWSVRRLLLLTDIYQPHIICSQCLAACMSSSSTSILRSLLITSDTTCSTRGWSAQTRLHSIGADQCAFWSSVTALSPENEHTLHCPNFAADLPGCIQLAAGLCMASLHALQAESYAL